MDDEKSSYEGNMILMGWTNRYDMTDGLFILESIMFLCRQWAKNWHDNGYE